MVIYSLMRLLRGVQRVLDFTAVYVLICSRQCYAIYNYT